MKRAMRRIVVLNGHPDSRAGRFVHALANAYADAAAAAGHEVRFINVGELKFAMLRTADDFLKSEPSPAIQGAQADIEWCDHLVILYPLWLGSMPALLKGFLEQLFRPGFAFKESSRGLPKKMLTGKSARIVVTMGMPSLFYKWYFRAHSLKSLERNILKFSGIDPVRHSLVGGIESSAPKRAAWVREMRRLGKAAR